ncbi:signal transduction histidine kinase [Haloferula luteola]|uniref:histidine kinase n=1 Tax=Haloferula luteola TaxID=595692 RepID=A0A840VF90_9BACT|nr:HAMP domain-containing sensor histidine kinase [Haloferula luteola]MBB5352489.1 signal transduction histidine kinase [Haloferula luteola]
MSLVACAVVILLAMGALTRSVTQAERERSQAEARARMEEKVRLSLWRMDALAASVAIEENQRVLTSGSGGASGPWVKARFRVDRAGHLEAMGQVEPAALDALTSIFLGKGSGARLFGYLGVEMAVDNLWYANGVMAEMPKEEVADPATPSGQTAWNINERAIRAKAVNRTVTKAGLEQNLAAPGTVLASNSGAFQPVWVEGDAFLLRAVGESGRVVAIEGVWLDVEAFRKLLLGEIQELLPDATLEPSTPGANDEMTLASFPWRLIPGESPVAESSLRAPVQRSLTAGWVAVVVALLAGGFLIGGISQLSERRATFVSAVTHELRTPLTTFRLYSEMLAGGWVRDPDRQNLYYETMKREADRLSHLVENVLGFSRIERRCGSPELEAIDLVEFLETQREGLEGRLKGSGLSLVMHLKKVDWGLGHRASMEHLLFNLVDNAAKYAVPSDPPEVVISLSQEGTKVALCVADHGPGVPARDRRRVFRAFHKSAAEAAGSRPGVGLGLALSRRLAKGMGGSLEYRDGPGAQFVLRLRATPSP